MGNTGVDHIGCTQQVHTQLLLCFFHRGKLSCTGNAISGTMDQYIQPAFPFHYPSDSFPAAFLAAYIAGNMFISSLLSAAESIYDAAPFLQGLCGRSPNARGAAGDQCDLFHS